MGFVFIIGIYMSDLSVEEEQRIHEMTEYIMSNKQNNGKTSEEVFDILAQKALDKQQKSVIISDTNKRNNK